MERDERLSPLARIVARPLRFVFVPATASASRFPALSLHFSRNLQTGESEVTSSAIRVAHLRIYHDAEHRSRIELPVIPR